MPRTPSQHPTDLELEILKVLWRVGPATGRGVRDALAGGGAGGAPRDLAYTSVMTVMTIMVNKGYLRRRKVDGGYVYQPKAPRDSTVGRMLRDLVDRAFAGSAGAAMLNLLNTSEVTPDELKALRSLIEAKERQSPASPRKAKP